MGRHRTSTTGMIVYVHSRIRPRSVVAVAGGVVHSRLRPRMVVVVVGGERRSKRQTDDRRCRGENLRHSESSLTTKLAHKAYVNLNASILSPPCVKSSSTPKTTGLDPLDGHRVVEIWGPARRFTATCARSAPCRPTQSRTVSPGTTNGSKSPLGLSPLNDADRIRRKILLPFETAERIAAGGTANREYTTANRPPAAGQDITVMLPPRRLRPPENRGLVSSINH